ncbi:MAG: S4 domain-containing protein, partial [Verrucomicrobiota bacterium]
ETKFSKRDLAQADLEEKIISENPIWIVKLLQDLGAAPSGGEARRLIQAGAVSLDGEKVIDPKANLTLTSTPQILKAGKKFFVKIKTG